MIKGLGSAGLLLALLVGAPVALWAWGRPAWQLPGLLVADSGGVLVALLTAVGWLAWAAFVASTVMELVNLVTGRRLVLPLVSGLQWISGALLVAAVAGLGVAGRAAPAMAAPTMAAPAAAPATVASPTIVQQQDEPDAAQYTVVAGDDLWTIAERLLGDGRQWRALAELNPELREDPTQRLHAGNRLRLPAAPEAERAPVESVTVRKGDTLSGLALEHLGAARKWPAIHQANRSLIRDPDLIQIGWKLALPTGATHPKPIVQDQPPRKDERSGQGEPSSQDERSGQGEPSSDQGGPQGQDRPQGSDQPPNQSEPPAMSPDASTPNTSAPVPTASPTAEHPPIPEASRAADPVAPLVGGLGGLAAAMMLSAVAVRRQAQLRSRNLGVRVPHPEAALRRYETALGRRQQSGVATGLERALRVLGEHFERTLPELPALDRVVIEGLRLSFQWVEPPATTPPRGFVREGTAWVVDLDRLDVLEVSTHAVPYPTLVTLGRTAAGVTTMVELERRGLVSVEGAAELCAGVIAAWVAELGCAPWAAELRLVVAAADASFCRAVLPDNQLVLHDPRGLVEGLEREAVRRRAAFAATSDQRSARLDPDRAEASAPWVAVLADQPPAELLARISAACTDLGRGVVLVAPGLAAASTRWQLTLIDGQPDGTLMPDRLTLSAQLIEAHTRDAIGAIARTASMQSSEPASWWSADPQPDNVALLPSAIQQDEPGEVPTLLLLGPVELTGARGEAPTRARRQCEEYCGWLLENPGRTATQMSSELLVAEGTRRSNMSRLRTWLGADGDGQPYLPDAYSGRIQLAPAVTSDWQRVQLLLTAGANRVHPDTLRAVLDLVRGAPLADAAPGQWHWAEQLRSDMSSAIRDVGVVLAQRARNSGDLELARWATARALLAAAEDERLLCERILTERQAGNRPEVERLVMRLTRHARSLGVDLAPETVRVCQQAMEGRVRARA